MRQVLPLLLLTSTLLAALPAHADEGMWPYDLVPRATIHGLALTDPWLEHLRLASVRFGGASASFVSAEGLILTNHHVGSGCIQQLGTPARNLMRDGYLAKTRKDELKCPDVELNVLQRIEDVTAQVRAAAKPEMTPAQANHAQKQAMTRLEQACAQGGLRCDVVTLYNGGLYHLYTYRKLTDVRLVFAPEAQIAFFGGDPDNFTFPRFDLDMALFRAYENGKPARPDRFLKLAAKPAAEGDLVVTSGHPGGTSRLLTVAELELLRDQAYPARLDDLARQRQVLLAYAATSDEAARQARNHLFGLENGLKALGGYLAGLRSSSVLAERMTTESSERTDPTVAKALDTIADATRVQRELFSRYRMTEGFTLQTRLFGWARQLVRLADERPKANDERLREYRDSNLASLEQGLFSPAPVYLGLEEALLADALEHLKTTLGDADPVVVAALAGQTPAERAKRLISQTKLQDPAERKTLAKGGAAAIQASTDPLIVLSRALDAEARALRTRMEDEVEGPLRRAHETLAEAAFAQYGTKRYPDATGTLRLSFGKVAGYSEDDGTAVAPITTFGGLFARSDKAGGKAPWDLPESWKQARGRLNLATPFNLASTNDIIGGNSGSPLVNRDGELVGLVFDGNLQSLAGQFFFDERQNRTVAVHAAAIVQALRSVYRAAALADELEGRTVAR
jgi:hypothetical protein